MNSERLWISLLALTSFCAGLAAGVLYFMRTQETPSSGPFAAYETRLVRDFELGDDQVRTLRYVLDQYDADLEGLKTRHVRDLEGDVIKAGDRSRSLIRNYVIPQERREEFDRLAKGFPVGS